MRYNKIHIGKKYRITYKETKARRTHWDNGLLPQAGIVVIISHIRERMYAYPITIQDKEDVPYHCRSNDLVRYEKESYSG